MMNSSVFGPFPGDRTMEANTQDSKTGLVSPPASRALTPSETEPAELAPAELAPRPPDAREPSLPFRLCRFLGGLIQWCFGLASLLIGLAVVATIPLLQFLSLGYLLQASARVARSGRLRDGLIGVRKAARIGSFIAGAWLVLLPLYYLSDVWYSAQLIDPESDQTFFLRRMLVLCVVLGVGHIVSAWYAGGRPMHFAWPLPLVMFFAGVLFRQNAEFANGMIVLSLPLFAGLAVRFVLTTRLIVLLRPFFALLPPRLRADLNNLRPVREWFPPAAVLSGIARGRFYATARDRFWEFFTSLHLTQYFWLGLRGFIGALAWLVIPVLFLIGATELPDGLAIASGLIGVPLMAILLLYLPFLQTHMAAENRLGAIFEVGMVRQLFRRAPLAFWLSLLITLLFALPLYLLKIEGTPREVAWLPSLVFIVFIFPARLLTGWAVGRARKRQDPRFFLSRWAARLAALPVVAAFVFVLFFTRYTSWGGSWSLFEQHAFLLPVPFVSM